MQQATPVQNKKAKLTFDDFEEVLLPDKQTSAIGKGSYGVVRLVKQKNTPNGPLLAMKIINKKMVVESGSVSIINREIKIHKKLEHPHIIKLRHAFEDKQNIYLVLDYAEHGSLFQYIRKKKKLTEKEIFVFFFQTCIGIDYLHKKGILHRDLKPENLLLDNNGNIKICDFGWSTEVADGRNTFCGTMDYMAPEMVENKSYDHRVDIWSLGVLLYELAHGHEPFRAKSHTQKLQQILDNDYTISPEISPLIKDLIEKLLRANPDERFTFQQIFEHDWLKKFAKDFKIDIKTYVYEPSNRSKVATHKRTVSQNKPTEDLNDTNTNLNDTCNTSLNMTVVDFEPVTCQEKGSEGKVAKSENVLAELNEIQNLQMKMGLNESKSLADIASNENVQTVATADDSVSRSRVEENGAAGKGHTRKSRSILEKSTEEKTVTVIKTKRSATPLCTQEGSSCEVTSTKGRRQLTQKIKKTPAQEKNVKSMPQLDETLDANASQQLSESLQVSAEGTFGQERFETASKLKKTPSQDESSIQLDNSVVDENMDNVPTKLIPGLSEIPKDRCNSRKTSNSDISGCLSNTGKATPIMNRNWSNVSGFSVGAPVEEKTQDAGNPDSASKVRLTDLDKYFKDIDKDETVKVLNKVEARSKTSSLNDLPTKSSTLQKVKEPSPKSVEDSFEKSEQMIFKREISEEKSWGSMDLTNQPESHGMSLNLSKIDNRNSEEKVKSSRRGDELTLEKKFSFGEEISQDLSTETEKPKSFRELSKKMVAKNTPQRAEEKPNASKKNVDNDSDSSDSDSDYGHPYKNKINNDKATAASNAYKISEKGSEEEVDSPDVHKGKKLHNRSHSSIQSGSQLEDSLISKALNQNPSPLQRDNLLVYYYLEMDKLQNKYNGKARLDSSLDEKESPYLGPKPQSKYDFKLNLNRSYQNDSSESKTDRTHNKKANQKKRAATPPSERSSIRDSEGSSQVRGSKASPSFVKEKLSFGPKADASSSESPGEVGKKVRFAKKNNRGKPEVTISPKLGNESAADPNQSYDVEREFGLVPGENATRQADSNETIESAVKSKKKDGKGKKAHNKYQAPVPKQQKLGFFDRVISMLTCAKK